MKMIQSILLLTLASLSVTTGVLAQERAVSANVPFAFSVGERLLPAGEYVLSSPTSGIIQIRSADRQFIAEVTASHSNDEADAGAKLVFNRYGSEYFLHRVLDRSTYRLNLDLGSSKMEKQARARQQEAKLPPEAPVLIAAR